MSLDTRFLNNTLHDWLLALGTFVVTLFVVSLVKNLVERRLEKIAPTTSFVWDDMFLSALRWTRKWALVALALYVGLHFLELSARYTRIPDALIVVAFLIQGSLWGNALITFWVEQYIGSKSTGDAEKTSMIRAISVLVKIGLYAILLLWGLDNLGVNVTSLVAGLGIGGVAVALAAQNILGDLFASLSIVLDKPFVLGDSIQVGEFSGTVEKIGLKTTRLKSATGELLVFANSDLLQSRIRNYRGLWHRRIQFQVGIVYETRREQLQEIPKMISDIIAKQEKARLERVHLKSLGASSLDYEIAYWVLDSNYVIYMDTHQKILFDILKTFEQQKIQFAYPTQTVIVQQTQPGRT